MNDGTSGRFNGLAAGRFNPKKQRSILEQAVAFRVFIAGATGPSTFLFETPIAPKAPARLSILNDTLDVKKVEASADGEHFVTVFERKD